MRLDSFGRHTGLFLCVQEATAVKGGGVMRFVIHLVGNATMVEETLNAAEVATLAVVADELDQLPVRRASQYQRL